MPPSACRAECMPPGLGARDELLARWVPRAGAGASLICLDGLLRAWTLWSADDMPSSNSQEEPKNLLCFQEGLAYRPSAFHHLRSDWLCATMLGLWWLPTPSPGVESFWSCRGPSGPPATPVCTRLPPLMGQ